MDIYNLSGAIRIDEDVTDKVIDTLYERLNEACPVERLDLDREGNFLSIKLIAEASYGSAHDLDAVIRDFCKSYATESCKIKSNYGGEKDKIPMLSKVDMLKINALLTCDGVTIEDAISTFAEASYMGDGEWIVNGKSLNHQDLSAMFVRQREDEIRKSSRAESAFLPSEPFNMSNTMSASPQ